MLALEATLYIHTPSSRAWRVADRLTSCLLVLLRCGIFAPCCRCVGVGVKEEVERQHNLCVVAIQRENPAGLCSDEVKGDRVCSTLILVIPTIRLQWDSRQPRRRPQHRKSREAKSRAFCVRKDSQNMTHCVLKIIGIRLAPAD
jgi:hypothetical protein